MGLFNRPESRRPGFKLAFLACLAAIIVLGMGVFTRLADAGLGCPDWPGCYGHLDVPLTSEEVSAANEAFPERPVEAGKAWKEMIHRYAAAILGLLILGMSLLSEAE
mgnify:CR=1 FL=1